MDTFRAMRALLEEGYLVLTGGASHDTLSLTPALTIDERLLDGRHGVAAEPGDEATLRVESRPRH